MRRKPLIVILAVLAIGLLFALPVFTGKPAPETAQIGGATAPVIADKSAMPDDIPADDTPMESVAEEETTMAAPPPESVVVELAPPPTPILVEEGTSAGDPETLPLTSVKPETALPTLAETDSYVVQRVFFGTDRKETEPDGSGPTFGAGRATALSLGTAQITIPRKAHKSGKVERPLSITLFRVTIPLQRENRDKHMTIHKRSLLSPSEFRAFAGQAAAQSQTYAGTALVFIHGFNFGFDEAVFRTAQIAHDLDFDGPAFLYSWPSQDRLASYVTDTDSADRAAPFMDEFLDHVFETPGVDRVHIIAHSMGNRALAGLLVRAGTRLSQRGRAFDQMILAAPDIDATIFATVAQHFTAAANHVTLYACGSDRALLASRKLRDDYPRAGDVPDDGPIILPGVETIDVTGPGTTMFSLNHNAYVESHSVLADLRLILTTGLHPPAIRLPSLREKVLERGKYWLMPE